MKIENKEYLGDSVYASTDGYDIRLTIEDGLREYDSIVLEPAVFSALIAYAKANRLKS